MLAKLDPNAEVPDPLYLAALEHAVSPEEVAFRDVLLFHRDFLNGGLDQALFNLSNTGQALAPYVGAYQTIGLTTVAELIEDAASRADDDAGFDEIDERYQRFTYGENNEQPDAVEAALVRFAQKNETAFTSVIQAAEKGDFTRLNFGELA